MSQDMNERVYTQHEINLLSTELGAAKASVPVFCKRCGQQIKRFDFTHNPEDALLVTLDGGYAMFVDAAPWGFHLCKGCATELCAFLGINPADESWGEGA